MRVSKAYPVAASADRRVDEELELLDVILRALLRAHGLVGVDIEEDVLIDLGELLVEFGLAVHAMRVLLVLERQTKLYYNPSDTILRRHLTMYSQCPIRPNEAVPP